MGKIHERIHTSEKPSAPPIAETDNLQRDEDKFQCKVCDKKFSESSKLQIHERRFHSNKKPFTCTICNKPFVESSPLKRHLMTHTGEKPFPCKYCDKKFSQLSNAQQHERIQGAPYVSNRAAVA